MSFGAEILADYAFERDFPFGMPSDVWTKRDGTKIKLTEMSESHIKNCMRIVGEDDPWYGEFYQELKRRKMAKVMRNAY